MRNIENESFVEMMTGWRRSLHQIPEMEFALHKTKAYIVGQLKAMGYEPELQWGRSAVVAKIQGKRQECLAFRADMDALTVTEMTGASYASQHPGIMHACGHDGHMAALLGLAYALKQPDAYVPEHSILFVFQPAEEGPGGAELLVKEGLMKQHHVTAIIGVHIFPGLPQGIIGLKAGPFMAQNGEVDITVKGKSAHGAQPQQGVDAIVAAADLIMRIQAIPSREVSPLDPVVITFGRIEGGERCNIIAGEVKLSGTIRAFKDSVFRSVQDSIVRHSEGTASAFGCSVEVVYRDMYPAVNNDEVLVEMVSDALLPGQIVRMEPQMLAEDFAFYQQEVPGLFYFIGSANKEKGFEAPLHNACFNFDERVLSDIVSVNLKAIESYDRLGGLK